MEGRTTIIRKRVRIIFKESFLGGLKLVRMRTNIKP
jgi:hypothetical protein